MATVREQGGYLLIEGLESAEDEVELSFPMRVSAHTLPDNPHAAAFTYGPYVLSADLGTEDMEETTTGVDVTVPAGENGDQRLSSVRLHRLLRHRKDKRCR